MNKPHKWAEVIKAWADGAQVQLKTDDSDWSDIHYPSFSGGINTKYRIKPEPDYVRYVKLGYCIDDGQHFRGAYGMFEGVTQLSFNIDGYELTTNANIKVTYDGETNEPKAVELIKA